MSRLSPTTTALTSAADDERVCSLLLRLGTTLGQLVNEIQNGSGSAECIHAVLTLVKIEQSIVIHSYLNASDTVVLSSMLLHELLADSSTSCYISAEYQPEDFLNTILSLNPLPEHISENLLHRIPSSVRAVELTRVLRITDCNYICGTTILREMTTSYGSVGHGHVINVIVNWCTSCRCNSSPIRHTLADMPGINLQSRYDLINPSNETADLGLTPGDFVPRQEPIDRMISMINDAIDKWNLQMPSWGEISERVAPSHTHLG